MFDYYDEKLSAEKLKRCYEVATPRVQQYLKKEIDFVNQHLNSDDIVLELGCGYGRIFASLTDEVELIAGIDTSLSSLQLGRKLLKGMSNYHLVNANALHLPFFDASFDCVLCIQNGISSFHVDKSDLIGESIRVCKSDGVIVFSSYSDKFWDERLRWFEIQSAEGLLGEIDYERTKNGEIAFKDGFTITTANADEFLLLTSNFNVDVEITEVDESSLFCVMKPQ